MNKDEFIMLMYDVFLYKLEIYIPNECILDKKYKVLNRFNNNSITLKLFNYTYTFEHISLIEKLFYNNIPFIIEAYRDKNYNTSSSVYSSKNDIIKKQNHVFLNSSDEKSFWNLSDKEKENIKIFNLINNI